MKAEEQEKCFCQKPKSSIRLYVNSGFVPDDALLKKCCWNRIDAMRMLEKDIPGYSWENIVNRRKALIAQNRK